MRPALAIIPLALLLSWFGPSPSGEADQAVALGLAEGRQSPVPEPSAAEQVAQAWESIQWSGLRPTTSEQASRR